MNSEDVEFEQTKALRRYFLIRLAVVAVVVWVFSWPIPLLPHTVLWVLFATTALLVGLTSTPRSRRANRDTRRTLPH
jgi:membrane protein implicated in regulation of membrane protease activity